MLRFQSANPIVVLPHKEDGDGAQLGVFHHPRIPSDEHVGLGGRVANNLQSLPGVRTFQGAIRIPQRSGDGFGGPVELGEIQIPGHRIDDGVGLWIPG